MYTYKSYLVFYYNFKSMAPKGRPGCNNQGDEPLTSAAVEEMIAQRVADALTEYETI
jgi:hypothetical protein